MIAETPGGYGYDMNYCFASNGSLQQMAILASPKTGRLLEVKSTLPGLQVYTGNWLNTKGKFNVDYVSMINYAVMAKVITNWLFGWRLTNFIVKIIRLLYIKGWPWYDGQTWGLGARGQTWGQGVRVTWPWYDPVWWIPDMTGTLVGKPDRKNLKNLTNYFRWRIQRLHWSRSIGPIHQIIQIFLRQHFDLDSDILKLFNLIFIKSKVKPGIHWPGTDRSRTRWSTYPWWNKTHWMRILNGFSCTLKLINILIKYNLLKIISALFCGR